MFNVRKYVRSKLFMHRHVADPATRRLLRGRDHEQATNADGLLEVRLDGLAAPVYCRPGWGFGSDVSTVWEIFCKRVYAFSAVDFSEVETVVDVGANVGMFGLFLAWGRGAGSPLKRYVAVEPDASSSAVLARNLETLSAMGVECQHVAAAAGAEEGTASFRSDAQSILNALDASGGETVRVARIDTILRDTLGDDAAIDVLKMDIEGGEAAALPTVDAWGGRVRHLMLELHEDLDPKLTVPWAKDLLRPLGFEHRRSDNHEQETLFTRA